MSDTPRLGLPRLAEGQASAEVVHDDALHRLDVLRKTFVEAHNAAAPPASPVNGRCYHIGAGATGAWAGKGGYIAVYQSGWLYYLPSLGFMMFDQSSGELLVKSNTDPLAAWDEIPSEA